MSIGSSVSLGMELSAETKGSAVAAHACDRCQQDSERHAQRRADEQPRRHARQRRAQVLPQLAALGPFSQPPRRSPLAAERTKRPTIRRLTAACHKTSSAAGSHRTRRRFVHASVLLQSFEKSAIDDLLHADALGAIPLFHVPVHLPRDAIVVDFAIHRIVGAAGHASAIHIHSVRSRKLIQKSRRLAVFENPRPLSDRPAGIARPRQDRLRGDFCRS